MSARPLRNPIGWLGGLLAAYLILPVLFVVARVGSGHAVTPGAGLARALGISFITATASTAVCGLLGVPLAYVLARRSRGWLSGVLGVAVQLPLALPPLMSGILLVSLLGPVTPIGRLFGGRLTDSMAGIVLSQTFVAAPFAVVAARNAFASIDDALFDVSATLGWSEWSRFIRVALPVGAGSIAAGLMLAWLRAFGEFGATMILAYHPYSLPVYTYLQFSESGVASTLLPTLVALGLAFAVLGLVRIAVRRRPRRAPAVMMGATVAEPRRSVALPVSFELDHQVGDFRLNVAHRQASSRLAILGPSGSGKSMALSCMAGLRGTGAGEIWLGGRAMGAVPVEQRRFGYVPQGPSLLPHLSVRSQVLMGRGADPAAASYWLAQFRLDGLGDRLPGELSNGQRQRVAIVRALCRAPELVLLDEPSSALDVGVRAELRRELRRVQRQGRFSTVLVTHDPEEAALLADFVIVLDEGRVVQSGRLADVYARPRSPEVAKIIGMENISRGRVIAPGLVYAGGLTLRSSDGTLAPGTDVFWSVLPEHVGVRTAPRGSTPRHQARVVDVIDLGVRAELLVELNDSTELVVRPSDGPVPAPGSSCEITIGVEHLRIWPAKPANDSPIPGVPQDSRRLPKFQMDHHSARSQIGDQATTAQASSSTDRDLPCRSDKRLLSQGTGTSESHLSE